MIANAEHVARALFSPRMIFNGEILPEAFKLRPSICESYLSVMRMSVSSWMNDIKAIPQHKNRILYGYAEMEVGEIRNIKLKNVHYDVAEFSQNSMPSHAGIYITANEELLVGGKLLKSIENGKEQDFLMLAIQRELVDIAQRGLHILK